MDRKSSHEADPSVIIQFVEPSPGADLSPLRRLLCGGAAGITSVTFTYPLDIVRTRLSIQSASFASLGEASRKQLPGMWATLKTMYKTEGGVLALYRGITPTVAGVAPYVRYALQVSNEVMQLILDQGRLELHDLRIRTEMAHAGGGQEPVRPQETSCWSHIRRGCSNVHLSIVSFNSPHSFSF